jgi:protein SCO1/2
MRRRPPSRFESREAGLQSALVLLLSLLSLTASVSAAGDAGLKAGTFSPPRVAPDFSLRGSDGAPLKLSHYRAKVVLLAFGYTSCTEVCPVTLAILARARRELGAQGKDVQVLYVTVDPERDTAEQMQKFLAAFDATFIGGTGSAEQLAAVRRSYGVVATRTSVAGGYSIAHSSYTMLIDRDGNLRALMPFGHPAEDYVHDVRILLQK